jgi:uncharacterized protein YjdB
VPVPKSVKVAFEVRDSGTGKVERLICRDHAVITVDGDIAKNETDLTKVVLAAVIYPGIDPDDGAAVLFDRQTTPVISSLAIAPSTKSIIAGNIAALTATATYDDTSTADVTSTAAWSTSAPSKATVTAGYVTAVAAGSATITAAFEGQTGTCAVTVTAS